MKHILISGAGIAGLSLARQLKKHGIAFTLIEKKSTLEMIGAGIALPANAVRALRYMGLSDAVARMHQVESIIYARNDGRVISQASLLNAPLNLDKFVALDRAELLAVLQQDLQNDIHFNTTITGLKQTSDGVEATCSSSALSGHYHAVVGADGLHSTVRTLGFGQGELVDLGVTCWRWICAYPTAGLQPTYMFGMNNMFLAYPIGPDRIYCYAHQTDVSGQDYHGDKARDHLQDLFAAYQGIAAPLLQLLPDHHAIYTGRLRSVPAPLFSQDDMALIGDAGNACSPMLQQGAACAFEDAIVLAELLAIFPVREALQHYRALRQERVNWIVKTSDDGIKAFVKMNSRWSVMLRTLFMKRKGPLNVLGWKHLLSKCPLGTLDGFILANKLPQ